MPKKQYRHTDYAQRAKKKAKSKVIRVAFELNIPQTKQAREIDPLEHGAKSVHTLAKKLFLEYMEEISLSE